MTLGSGKCGTRVIRTRFILHRSFFGFYLFYLAYSPTNPTYVGSGVLLVFSWTRFRPGIFPVVEWSSLMEATPRFPTHFALLLLGLVLMSVVCGSFLLESLLMFSLFPSLSVLAFSLHYRCYQPFTQLSSDRKFARVIQIDRD